MNNNYKRLAKAEKYEYTRNGVVVYGQDSNGYYSHMIYACYDSLADIKRHMVSDGIKNVSHIRKIK